MKNIILIGLALSNLTGLGFNENVEYKLENDLSYQEYQGKKEIGFDISTEDDMAYMNGLTPDDDVDFRMVRAYLIDELTQTFLLTDGGGNFFQMVSANDYTGLPIIHGRDFLISVTDNKSKLLNIINEAEFTEIDTIEILNNQEYIQEDIEQGKEMFKGSLIRL